MITDYFGIFNENCLAEVNNFGSTRFTRKSVNPMKINVIRHDNKSLAKVWASPSNGSAVTYMRAKPYAAASIDIRGFRMLVIFFITDNHCDFKVTNCCRDYQIFGRICGVGSVLKLRQMRVEFL